MHTHIEAVTQRGVRRADPGSRCTNNSLEGFVRYHCGPPAIDRAGYKSPALHQRSDYLSFADLGHGVGGLDVRASSIALRNKWFFEYFVRHHFNC